jgi:hypothetical protein
MMLRITPMTVAKKPGHWGEREVNRKTIARGMPGVPGVTVVTNACAFYQYTRGCGRIGRPAFPAPLIEEGGKLSAKLARIARRDREAATAAV